jgi:hypothetical protein
MSTGKQAENIVDFAAYRAHRDGKPSFGAAREVPYSAFMFAMPIMIPIVAWMPVWTSASVAHDEGSSE